MISLLYADDLIMFVSSTLADMHPTMEILIYLKRVHFFTR
jgi:hypothetical protein